MNPIQRESSLEEIQVMVNEVFKETVLYCWNQDFKQYFFNKSLEIFTKIQEIQKQSPFGLDLEALRRILFVYLNAIKIIDSRSSLLEQIQHGSNQVKEMLASLILGKEKKEPSPEETHYYSENYSTSTTTHRNRIEYVTKFEETETETKQRRKSPTSSKEYVLKKSISYQSCSVSKRIEKTRSKIRINHPKAVVSELKAWFNTNRDFPYPSQDEKDDLMAKTGLNLQQLNDWFINARRRY